MSEAATITLPLGGKSQGNHTDLGPNIIELLKQHQKVPTFELLYEEKKNCLSHFLVSFLLPVTGIQSFLMKATSPFYVILGVLA